MASVPTRAAAGLLVLFLFSPAAACSRESAREYELRGQILAVDPSRQEVTIKHEDIPQFMPGMTMAFKVADGRLLDGRIPGDLVKATLVVSDRGAHLRTLERTGHSPVADPAPLPMSILEPGEPVADAAFVDERGAARKFSDWRGHAVAVTFIYTRCPLPDFCPLMDRHFKAVQDRIAGDPRLAARARLLSVSFDPGYDTPAVLSAHAKRVQADPSVWQFVTSEAAAVDKFARQFGVSVTRGVPGEEIVHNLRTAVVDGDGRLAAILRGSEWTPDQLVDELTRARAGDGPR